MVIEELVPPAELPETISIPFRSFHAGSPAWVVAVLSTAAAGDLSSRAPGSGEARQRVAPGWWYTARQVHGSGVAIVSKETHPISDALLSPPSKTQTGHLAMFSADCALVAVVSDDGFSGIAHCGWRGLEAGILGRLAAAMRELGAGPLAAVRGPCIGPECYEFGEEELERIVKTYGPSVAARTKSGGPALELREGVRIQAREAGIESLLEVNACTACAPGWFSFRKRGESARFALAVRTGP